MSISTTTDYGYDLGSGRVSRRDDEPILVAEFTTRAEAEEAWLSLVDGGVPSIVVTDDPPWGQARHIIQCARRDAPAALELLSAE